MPRQRIDHSRIVYVFPDDFPQRLKRFQEESGLPWAEIARRLGTSPYTVWRWHEAGVRPYYRHLMALLELADSLGLGHLFTGWRVPDETQGQRTPAQASRPVAAEPGGKPQTGKAPAPAGAETRKGRHT